MHDERDTIETPFRASIQALYRRAGIVPTRSGFGCCSLPACSERGQLILHTGNWAFVGSNYGQAKVGGYSARILFVAMDRGGHGGADDESFPDTQASFRRSIELPKNPHMGGLALLLKHVVDDREPRKLSGQCALTNAVKCVQHTGSMSTDATRTMITKCSNHLGSEITALEPDIIITQGGHPTETIHGLVTGLVALQEFAGESRGRATLLANSRLIVLTTPHPARLPGLKWARGMLPAFLVDATAAARGELVRRLRSRDEERSSA